MPPFCRRRHGVNSGGVVEALQKRLRAVRTTDVNSHSLGIKITDPRDRTRKINHIMIPRNTPVPHNVKQKFGTNTDGQQRIHVEILEGDAVDPAACELIGDFRITSLPSNLPKGSPIEITYAYDSAGRISAISHRVNGQQDCKYGNCPCWRYERIADYRRLRRASEGLRGRVAAA
jgi:molecular chaperone DnaK